MKFIQAPDDSTTGLTNRLVSENNLVEIGVFRVIFGRRVRAGFVGDPVCQIDWCCGDSVNQLWSHFTAIYLILSRRDEDDYCFRDVPTISDIKPCFKDEKFEQRLTEILTSSSLVSEKVAP